MEFLLWIFAAASVALLLGLVFIGRMGASAPSVLVLPEDAGELDALGAQLVAEHHRATGAPLAVALERLRSRGVPLTSVAQDGAIRRQFRLGFADGTSIVARPRGVADAGKLILLLQQQAVLVKRWSDEGDSYVMDLAWRAGSSSWEAVAAPGRDALSA